MEHPSCAVTRAEKELQRRSFILTRLIEQSREQTHNKPQSLPQELSTKPSKLSHQNSCPRFHSLVSSSSSLIRDDEDGEDADLDHLQSLRDEIHKLYTKHNLSLTGNRQGDEVSKDVPAPSPGYGHKGGCKSVVPVSVRRNGVNKVPCEVDIGKAVVALKVRVKAADMPSVMQDKAFKCARESLDSMVKLNSKKTALALKREFDTAYGPAWHCIVGTSFGSFVTHSLGGFLYFSIDKVSILLFKTAVEPLDQ